MASTLGYYGSTDVAVGQGRSRLVQVGSVFVRGIKVGVATGSRVNGDLVLYGLAGAPPLDVPAEWTTKARRVVVPAGSHREWVYFLNKGARIHAAYSIESETEPDVPYPLCILVAQGKEGFMQWIQKPAEHTTTASWHLVHGNGTIEQTTDHSSECYIIVHNLNDHQNTTVQLNFRIRTLIYNTTGAEYRCSLGQHVCTYSLPFLGQNVAVLSSGFKETLVDSDERRVILSYEPRWIMYILGSTMLAIVLMLLYEIASMLFDRCSGGGRSSSSVEQRTPLLTSKEDDGASLGSSYDSVSNDGDGNGDAEESGGISCVVCCDAPRDCFFLPCGHSATCYACGARIVEEHGSCPMCRRKLKKVRRIFAV